MLNSLKAFVKDGTIKEFALWNGENLGDPTYYVADRLVSGEVRGATGATFSVPTLGDYSAGDKSTVVLGPPQVFGQQRSVQFLTSDTSHDRSAANRRLIAGGAMARR